MGYHDPTTNVWTQTGDGAGPVDRLHLGAHLQRIDGPKLSLN